MPTNHNALLGPILLQINITSFAIQAIIHQYTSIFRRRNMDKIGKGDSLPVEAMDYCQIRTMVPSIVADQNHNPRKCFKDA